MAPKSLKQIYGLSILSGLLLYVSFFPLNLGWVAWVALVPLLSLVDVPGRAWHVHWAAFAGAMAFYIPALQWVRVAHPAMYATWAMLCVIAGVYFPIAISLLRALNRRGVSLMISLPAVWVGLEYMRAHFPTGFSGMESLGILHRIGFGWYFLGYSQHEFTWLIQLSDLTGVYGVSALVCIVNAAVYLALRPSLSNTPGTVRSWKPAVVAVVCLLAAVLYGRGRIDAEQVPGPRVALLQCNVPQAVKMTGKKHGGLIYLTEMTLFPFNVRMIFWPSTELDLQMAGLMYDAYDVPPERFPDLVVWPETTFDEGWIDVGPGVPKEELSPRDLQDHYASLLYARLMVQQGVWRSSQLLGTTGFEWETTERRPKFNSAKLINADGTPGPRYDKMHLVPFGEYVPLGQTFPWLHAFTPYTHEYSCKPGERWTRFPLKAGDKTFTFAAIICYEDSDPALARRYAVADAVGPPVDFLVNISNDGWFNGTEEHEQHLAICRFRAIECRRAIVRAVNMGISAIIDGNGQVVALPSKTWADSVKRETVVNGVVPIDHRSSLYARLGDWLPLACWAVVLLLLIVRRRIGQA